VFFGVALTNARAFEKTDRLVRRFMLEKRAVLSFDELIACFSLSRVFETFAAFDPAVDVSEFRTFDRVGVNHHVFRACFYSRHNAAAALLLDFGSGPFLAHAYIPLSHGYI